MALVKKAVRNGAVCYHHDSKEIFVLLCRFLPQGPTLYRLLNGGVLFKLRMEYTLKTLGSLRSFGELGFVVRTAANMR